MGGPCASRAERSSRCDVVADEIGRPGGDRRLGPQSFGFAALVGETLDMGLTRRERLRQPLTQRRRLRFAWNGDAGQRLRAVLARGPAPRARRMSFRACLSISARDGAKPRRRIVSPRRLKTRLQTLRAPRRRCRTRALVERLASALLAVVQRGPRGLELRSARPSAVRSRSSSAPTVRHGQDEASAARLRPRRPRRRRISATPSRLPSSSPWRTGMSLAVS